MSPHSPPETCNCSALRQAARRATKLYDDALAPVGVGLNQYAILSRLNRLGPKSIQELARLLVMDRSTLGHLLRPLEARGWVAIAVSDEDRRGRIVRLTPDGEALVTRARPLWAEAQAAYEQAFGPEGAAQLRHALKQVETLTFTAAPNASQLIPPQEFSAS